MNNKRKNAEQVFEQFKVYLDKTGWKYDTSDDDDLVIMTGAKGDDLPMGLLITIDERSQLISIWSKLPFSMGKDKLVEGALAVCIINSPLKNGCFDYDIHTGSIVFRVSTSWRGDKVDDSVFEYLISLSCAVVDEYNDKLLMLSKSQMSIEELYNFVHEG